MPTPSEIHERYLDYRERFTYFGRNVPMLSLDDFAARDAEYGALTTAARLTDEEEERLEELTRLLFRD